MSEGTRYYVWPVADERTLTLAMLLLVGLFAGAVGLELYRRKRDRKLRLRAEWRAVKDLCDERELSSDDWNMLRAILSQYAAEHPYLAVTKRTIFDECIARYFQAISTRESDSEMAERGARLREIRMNLGLDYVPFGRRIHTTRSLQRGQHVWAVAATGEALEWYHFEIVEVNESAFTMTLVGQDVRPQLPTGATLKFRLWREEDARYLFEAKLIGSNVDKGLWVLRHADTMTRNQSRAYYRLRVEQSVTVSILNASLKEDYEDIFSREEVTQVRGRITSLSGGGLAVVFQQPVPKQVLLRIPVSIPSLGGTLLVAVRPVASQSLSGGRCFLRGVFVAMDDETRETITRYIFSKQKILAGSDSTGR